MRKTANYNTKDLGLFLRKLLAWSDKYSNIAFLGSHGYYQNKNNDNTYHKFDYLIGVGLINEIKPIGTNGFNELKRFYDRHKDWIFGFLTYDMKNQVENLESNNFDNLKFPDYHFYIPEYVFEIKGDNIKLHYFDSISSKDDIDSVFSNIVSSSIKDEVEISVNINERLLKEDYLKTVRLLKDHIQIGDIYEINFCQEFYAENAVIEPLQTYLKLSSCSPTPFASYYKLNDKYLLSASPERFLKKENTKIISQPIKGTIHRGKNNDEDQHLISMLLNDIKERAENVMIVDLVRNDLSRTAIKGTVKVENLFDIQSFEQVHQMVSTVVSELDDKWHFTDCIKYAFPMGSMTGAPKIRAMKLIEEHESVKRGLFSGTVGYITPDGDFDFNVVIRSILYNSTEKYLSFITGGAITAKSIPENEYQECLVKAKAMLEALS